MVIENFSSALNLVKGSSYFILFLLMVVEGPIITAAAAFAASFGFLNVYIILLLSTFGNVVGDLIYYVIGRTGRQMIIDRFFKNVTKGRIRHIEHALKTHTGKALAAIKIIPSLPAPGLILAGASKVSLRKFLFYSFVISLIYSLFFTLAGFYLGFAFNTIYQYFQRIEMIMLIIIVLGLLTFIVLKTRKKVFDRITSMKIFRIK